MISMFIVMTFIAMAVTILLAGYQRTSLVLVRVGAIRFTLTSSNSGASITLTHTPHLYHPPTHANNQPLRVEKLVLLFVAQINYN